MSENNKIRVGIIGSGFGLYGHWKALSTLHDYEIVAVCGSKFTSEHAPHAYNSRSWHNVLNSHTPDLVVISVPPNQQVPILLECLKQNVMVFVEKPLCTNSNDLITIENAVKKYTSPSLTSFVFPEIETWAQAKKHLSQNSIGTLRSAYFDWRLESYGIKNKLDSWKTKTEDGGSALFHYMPHMIHAAIWFGGELEKISSVASSAVDLGPQYGNPIFSSHGFYKSGAFVSMSANLAAAQGSGHKIELNGSHGSLILENSGSDFLTGFTLTIKNLQGIQTIREEVLLSTLQPGVDSRTFPLKKLYSRFSDSLKNKGAFTPSIREALNVQIILERMNKSSTQTTWTQT